MALVSGCGPSGSVDACPFRFSLSSALCSLCCYAGFDTVDKEALYLIMEMFESLVVEVGRTSKMLCEFTGRSSAVPTDVVAALIKLGLPVAKLSEILADKSHTSPVSAPIPSGRTQHPRTLAIGKKRPHPSYVPPHLPPFPDAYTYISTSSQGLGETTSDYGTAREAIAAQEHGMRRSLVNLMVKIDTTAIALNVGNSTVHILSPKFEACPYLSALMPAAADVLADSEADEDTESVKGDDAD